jgi:ABC-type branched-subunit amino acid transport system ATPase component
MTALDNVLAAFKDQAGESALLSLVARWKIAKQENGLAAQARGLLTSVGLEGRGDGLAENLSYGQQKLLSLARLLALDADVLLLDEPTAGVSPPRVKEVLELIRKLARGGKSIVVIEHNMNVVLEIADWVFFMDEGQVASFGMPNEVLSDPEVRAAYMGL